MTDYEKQINTAAFRVMHEQCHAAAFLEGLQWEITADVGAWTAQISIETGTDFFDVLHDIKNRIRYLGNYLPADITGYRKI